MADRCFVLNEWVLHELAGEHGEAKRIETHRMLAAIRTRGDRIAVADGSPWAKKAEKLKELPKARSYSKFLHLEILLNPRCCRKIEKRDLPELQEGLRDETPEDDRYLVQTCLAANADLLVTTDRRLIDRLKPHFSAVTHRDDFLREYLSNPDEPAR